MLDNGSGGSNLPANPDDILRNMRAAVPARHGASAGALYARISHATGAVTFGRDDAPLPLDHLYAVPWREVQWGFKEFVGKTVVGTTMRPVAAGPCPLPAGDFTPYGIDGPRACMQLRLCSLREPGFSVIYSCLNESGGSRILDLWGEIAAQYAVNKAFANPVVTPWADSYSNQYGTTFCLAYRVRDWCADDGATLLSQAGDPATPLAGGAATELPF